jgi:hypothetical protein
MLNLLPDLGEDDVSNSTNAVGGHRSRFEWSLSASDCRTGTGRSGHMQSESSVYELHSVSTDAAIPKERGVRQHCAAGLHSSKRCV